LLLVLLFSVAFDWCYQGILTLM